MKEITFKCKTEDFTKIDIFINEQEYNDKPIIDRIKLIVDNYKIYEYELVQEFNHWYFASV